MIAEKSGLKAMCSVLKTKGTECKTMECKTMDSGANDSKQTQVFAASTGRSALRMGTSDFEETERWLARTSNQW
jgi:hypothetical protein